MHIGSVEIYLLSDSVVVVNDVLSRGMALAGMELPETMQGDTDRPLVVCYSFRESD